MSATDTQPLALRAEDYRADFPILSEHVSSGAEIVFLDNAASTQRPDVVIDAMSQCYREYYANVHRGIHTFSELSTSRYEQARERVASLINAETIKQVIFTAGTTAAINTVARSWGDANITSGDNILLTMAEHHANIVPWQQLAERVGAHVHFAPLTADGRLDLAVVAELLDRLRPKLFGLTAISNVLGTVMPVEDLVRLAKERGAVTLVDAAQAAPHQTLNVQAWQPDFLVFSGHKICGPTGIGILYGREQLLLEMPPFLGGGSMIQRVTTEGFEPAGLPEKFEAGTPPIVEAIGLAAAVDYVSQIGLERIESYERQLTERAHRGLEAIPGIRLLGPAPEAKAGIVSFVFDNVHAHDIAQSLDVAGVAVRAGHHCAMPLHQSLEISASTRASFYFYNTPAEVDRFVTAVAEARDRFAPRGRKRTRTH
ncbi:aminotransferase class V-fold PLP-dependent enzyme [Planctomycetaceae bacterium SH139]